MKKIFLLLCFVLIAIFVISSCTTNVEPVQQKNSLESKTAQGVNPKAEVDPKMKKYLGGGYSTDGNLIGVAVKNEYTSYWEPLSAQQGAGYHQEYKHIESSHELKQFLESSWDASIGVGYGWFSASASISSQITEEINFSSKSITYICNIDYIKGHALMGDDAELSENAMEWYQNNHDMFLQQYGADYVDKALLGEKLVYVLHVDATNTESSKIEELHAHLEAKFGVFVSGQGNVNIKEELMEISSNITFYSKIYATCGNGYLPAETGDEFIAQIEKFNNSIPVEYSELSPLVYSFMPYEMIVSNSFPPHAFKDRYKFAAWYIEKSEIEYMNNSIDEAIINQSCENALHTIDTEMQKCVNLNDYARYPYSNEFRRVKDKCLEYTTKVTGNIVTHNYGIKEFNFNFDDKLYNSWHIKYQCSYTTYFGANVPFGPIYKDGERAPYMGSSSLFITGIKMWEENLPSNVNLKYRAKINGSWTGWKRSGYAITGRIQFIEVKTVIENTNIHHLIDDLR